MLTLFSLRPPKRRLFLISLACMAFIACKAENLGGGGEGQILVIRDFTFVPSAFEASPGEVIPVLNYDNVVHSVTSESAPDAFDDTSSTMMGFDTGFIDSGNIMVFTIPESAEPGDQLFFYSVPYKNGMVTPNGTITIIAN